MQKNNTTAAPMIAGVIFVIIGIITLIGLMTFADSCGTMGFNAHAGRDVPGRCGSINFMQRIIAVIVIILGMLIVVFSRFGQWAKGFNLFALMLGIVLVFSATVISNNYNHRAHRLEVYEAFTGEIPPTFANATTEAERQFLAPQGWEPNPTGRFDMIRVARDGINANRNNFQPWPIDNRHVYRMFPPVVVGDTAIPIRIYASNPLANPNHPNFSEDAPAVNHVNFHIVWNNSNCHDGTFRNFNTIMGFAIIALAAIYAVFVDKTNLAVKPSFKNVGVMFVLVGGFAILGLQTFAGQCDLPIGQHGTQSAVFMRCVDISSHIYAVAILAIVSGLLMIVFGGSKGFVRALSIGVGMTGVFGILINMFAFTCATPTMPCNAGSFTPFSYIISGVLVLIAIINVFILSRKNDEEDEEIETTDNL